jgi:hypothetical protein
VSTAVEKLALRVNQATAGLFVVATRAKPEGAQFWIEPAGYSISPANGACTMYVGAEAMDTSKGVALSFKSASAVFNAGHVEFRLNLSVSDARALALRLLEDARNSEEYHAARAARG